MTFIKTVTILPVLVSNAEQHEMFLVWILISYSNKNNGITKCLQKNNIKYTVLTRAQNLRVQILSKQDCVWYTYKNNFFEHEVGYLTSSHWMIWV